MKTKHFLFVLFLAIQALFFGVYAQTDDLDYVALGLDDNNGWAEDFTATGLSSSAEYAGYMEIRDENFFFEAGNAVIASTASGGTIASVTIYWNTSEAEIGIDQISIYAQDEAYTGEETSGDGTFVITIGYDGTSSQSYDFSTSYSHVLLISKYEANVSHVEIEWVADVPHAITTVAAHGTITTKVGGSKVTSAIKDALVDVTVAKSKGYAIVGYSVYETADPTNKLVNESFDPTTAAQKFTFTMPDYAVTIEGVYVLEPTKNLTVSIVDASSHQLKDLTAMVSGVPLTYSYSVQSDYTGTVSPYTSNSSRAQVTISPTNAYSGTMTITPYLDGSVTVGLRFASDGNYKANNANEANITISGRNVILVTALNGNNYAVTHSVGGASATAQELLEQGGNYYYKTGVTLSDITWQVVHVDATHYYIKNGASYLGVDFSDMTLSGSPYQWGKSAGRFITQFLTGLCYDESKTAFVIKNEDVHASVSTISACVLEVATENVSSATKYTRSLTNGNYATICLPFPVSRSDEFFSGAEIYNITGKHMSGSTLTGIEMEEETGALVAGKPYIIRATAESLSAWYGLATAGSPVAAMGLVGNLGGSVSVPEGYYVIYQNKIRKVGSGATVNIGQNKAYLDMSTVPEIGGSPAPGRVMLYAEGEDSPTSIEDFLETATPINWNEPVYNTLGQRVGKGTTGVLIQNGKKFLIQ